MGKRGRCVCVGKKSRCVWGREVGVCGEERWVCVGKRGQTVGVVSC